MAINLDSWKTAIIPVTKKNGHYVLEVMPEIWNEIQVMIIEGGTKGKVTIEFKIETEEEIIKHNIKVLEKELTNN